VCYPSLMSVRRSPVREGDITPAPSSTERRRLEVVDVPAELRENPLVRYYASLTVEQQSELDGSFEVELEAGETYGDDAARELADLEAGRHPAQRPKPVAR
jgi:hypothetical protein